MSLLYVLFVLLILVVVILTPFAKTEKEKILRGFLSTFVVIFFILHISPDYGVPLKTNDTFFSPFTDGNIYIKTFEAKRGSEFLFSVNRVKNGWKYENIDEVFKNNQSIPDTSVFFEGKFHGVSKEQALQILNMNYSAEQLKRMF